MGEIANFGDTVNIIKEPQITVNDYTRGLTVNSTNLTDAELVLTIDQAKSFSFKLDDLERRFSHVNFQAVASDNAAYKLKDAMDSNILTAISTGGTIDMSSASGSAVYTIIGGAGTDNLNGDDGNDTFKIVASTEGNSDTIDGDGGSTNTLDVSSGTHVLTDNNKIVNIHNITLNNSTINLTNQAEGFKITGGSGTDNITGGSGDDIIIVSAAGQANSDTINGGGGTNKIEVSTGTHTLTTDGNISNISEVIAHASGSTINLSNQTEGFTITGNNAGDIITGGDGNDIIAGKGGDDTLTGGTGNDLFKIETATDSVLDLTNGDNFQVSGTAVMNATGVTAFSAGGTTSNASTSTANIHAHSTTSSSIDMSGAGSGKFKIFVGAGTDIIKGGASDDIITISSSGQGDADTIDGHTGTADVLALSTGTHTFNDNNKLKNIETITTHSSGSTLVLTNQLETFTITGGAGKDYVTGGNGVDTINTGNNEDTITGGAGDDIITGGSSNDIFNIDSGEDTVNDLTTGDVFVVSAGATLNAINVTNFIANSSSKNEHATGTAKLTAKASTTSVIKMNNAGAGKYNLVAGSGTDTLWGGSSDDIITIAASGQGDADTLDGYGGTDILQLSAGTHTFTTNDNMIQNIEEVKVDTTSGSTVDLTNQTEGFKITVGGQTDSVTGSDGNDIIVITSAGDGNNDTLIGGAGADVINLSAGSHTFSDNAKLATIETINANSSSTTLDLTNQVEGFTVAGGMSSAGGSSAGLFTKTSIDVYGLQAAYNTDNYGLSVSYALTEGYNFVTEHEDDGYDTTYWGLNGYYSFDDPSLPSISVGYEAEDRSSSGGTNPNYPALEKSGFFVGLTWDSIGPGSLSTGLSTITNYQESETEYYQYEAAYAYPLNDGVTITPGVFIKETSGDDETGIVVKTSFSF